MRLALFTLSVLALTRTSVSADQSPNIPTLVITSSNSASANYENKCSNGRNIDKVNRDKFLKLMLADKKSKLSQLKVALLNEIKQSGDEPRDEGVYIGEWNQTFHERIGCDTNKNSYSAFVETITGGNTNHSWSPLMTMITLVKEPSRSGTSAQLNYEMITDFKYV